MPSVVHVTDQYANNRGRSLPPTDASAEAPDAALQVGRSAPTIRVGSRNRAESLPSQSAPRKSRSASESGRPPSDTTFRVNAFEVPDQQQAEVGSRGQTRPSHRVGVERRALRLHKLVEGMRFEDLIQSLVERVSAGPGQRISGDPQTRRPCAVLATTHSRAGSVVRRIDRVDPLINHGLLGCHGRRERQARLLDEPAPVCYDPFPPTD